MTNKTCADEIPLPITLYLHTDFKSFEYDVVTVAYITGGPTRNTLHYISCYLLKGFHG